MHSLTHVLQASMWLLLAGYGMQNPESLSDCIVTTVSLFVGTCIWTFLASLVTSLLISLNSLSNEYMVKIQEIDAYMEHRRLPKASLPIIAIGGPAAMCVCHVLFGMLTLCAIRSCGRGSGIRMRRAGKRRSILTRRPSWTSCPFL